MPQPEMVNSITTERSPAIILAILRFIRVHHTPFLQNVHANRHNGFPEKDPEAP